MMFPTQPTSLPVTTSMPSMPPMSTMPTMPPMPSMPEVGPPTLTKEPPMPNLGPPNFNMGGPKAPAPAPEPTPGPPAKAVQAVKPQVLTHIIDGHVIKESSQPFPVSPTKKRSALGNDIKKIQKMLDKDIEDSGLTGPKKPLEAPAAPVAPVKRGPGRPPGSNNKNTEKKPGPAADEPPTKKAKPDKAPAEAVAPLTKPAPAVVKVNIARWSVAEVCEFIKQLPGCSDYVEDFMVQEIDGQALMLLQADHLMSAMSIKLGPALKICERVNQLKSDFAKN